MVQTKHKVQSKPTNVVMNAAMRTQLFFDPMQKYVIVWLLILGLI